MSILPDVLRSVTDLFESKYKGSLRRDDTTILEQIDLIQVAILVFSVLVNPQITYHFLYAMEIDTIYVEEAILKVLNLKRGLDGRTIETTRNVAHALNFYTPLREGYRIFAQLAAHASL